MFLQKNLLKQVNLTVELYLFKKDNKKLNNFCLKKNIYISISFLSSRSTQNKSRFFLSNYFI